MSGGIFSQGTIVIFVMFILYMVMGSLIEKNHCVVGHEASFIILIGISLSFAAWWTGHEEFNRIMTFDENFFFYFCLPPIVFASGYNMKRKKFFENISNILIFGLIGTVLQFCLFSIFTYFLVSLDFMKKYDPETETYEDFQLSIMEILLMCSLLCCTDVVAAVACIKYEEQPKLFSLVFGEGITNDAVCIILFNTVMEYSGEDTQFTAATPFKIIWSFIILSVFSILTGIVLGLFSSVFLKTFRFLTINPVIECNLIFCFGYLSYSLSEFIHCSGIIALLTCGILMSHYTWYNLSPQSKNITCCAFQVVGYAIEAFVFAYIGLTFFSFMELEWSFHLFIAEFIVVVVGRFIGTVGIIKFLELFKYKSGIRFKDLVFISYAGMIRGAVAFGLVLRIDKSVPNRSVIITTALSLVVFSTVVLGSTVATVSKCLFGKEIEEKKRLEAEQQHKDTKRGSHHEEFLHPNLEDLKGNATPTSKSKSSDNIQPNKPDSQEKKKGGILRGFRTFESKYLKPCLIHKYDAVQQKKQQEFNELFAKLNQQLEDEYAKNDPTMSQLIERKSQVMTQRQSRNFLSPKIK